MRYSKNYGSSSQKQYIAENFTAQIEKASLRVNPDFIKLKSRERNLLQTLPAQIQSNNSGHFSSAAVIIGLSYRNNTRPRKIVDEDEVWNIKGKTV